jgi:hypothetical protein
VVSPANGSRWLPKRCVCLEYCDKGKDLLNIGDITHVLIVLVKEKKMTLLFLTQYSSVFLASFRVANYIFSALRFSHAITAVCSR